MQKIFKSVGTTKLEHTASLLKLPDIDKDIDYADYENSSYDESDSDID